MDDIWEWWEPSREGLADNADIDVLNGQFANRDIAKGSGLSPINKTNQLNGLAIARFTGSEYMDAGPNPSALTEGHIFVVLKRTNSSGEDSGLWRLQTPTGPGSETYYQYSGDNHMYEGAGSNVRKSMGAPVLATNTWRVYEVVTTSTGWAARLDGTLQHEVFSNTVSFPTSFIFGVSTDGGFGNPRLRADVAGIYFFSAEKTGTGRDEVIDYINTRFALSSG